MKITNFSIRRPVFTLVAMTLFLLLGLISLINIPLKLIPDIDPPIGAVVTSYPDASPQEVASQVSEPMEESLSTLPGLNNISSISMEGSSLTLLEFSWATSIDDVENDILTNMNQTPLPDDASDPRFLKFDPSQFPIIQMSLSSVTGDASELGELVGDLEQELLKIDGVGSIDTLGDVVDEIRISLNQDDLEEYGLTQDEVVSALQAHNVTQPGGNVRSGDFELTTRVLFELTSVEDIENVVVTQDLESGDDVTVSDIGTVELTPEASDVVTRTNQDASILLSVQQQSDANTAEVSRAFNERLEELLEGDRYQDIDTAMLFDQGEFIEEAISNVSMALIAGGVFAMLVLFIFLRSFKTPLLIGIAIPFSVIVTFVLLYFTNFSLNIMTLGGLALGIGMLVDNSIVVIENIYRHLSMKKDPAQAARDGAKEVAGAITASTLTTVSVFLPVIFITGIVGNLFREFALTVSFSLFASLAVALTVVPMLAARWLKEPKENEEEKRRNSRFVMMFDRSARWSLRHRLGVLFITLLLLIGGGVGVTTVGTEFLPATDEGFFQVEIEMENGTPLEDTFAVIESVEEVLDGESLIKDYTSVTGSGGQEDNVMGSGGSDEGFIYVSMVPTADRNVTTMEFAESLRRDIERAAEDAEEVSIQLEASFGGNPNTYTFNVSDTNPNRLDEAVEEIYEELSGMSEFQEVNNDRTDTVREVQISIDDEAAREEGFTPAQIANAVNSIMRGTTATQIVTGDNDVYEVRVQYEEEFIEDLEALEDLLIRNNEGDYVALSDITEIEEGDGPVQINRINQEEAVQFTLLYGTQYNLGDIGQLIQSTIDDLDLDEETTVAVTGDQELLDDALGDLVLALILAIVFVYLVMAAQFESLRYPLVIMFSVPLVLIGVAIGLTVTQTPVSVMGFIGFIVLAGIVVNNAIVLVDYINKRKEAGLRSYDAIVEGVKDRARPIFMTAATTILGLVPLALGFGEGTELQQPLAITVISGLISGTFLTLFFIPVIYSFFDKETRNLNKKYVTPDGQLVPAYLLDERYTNDQGRSRQKMIADGKKEQEELDFQEFYREKEIDSRESAYLDEPKDVREAEFREVDRNGEKQDDRFIYDPDNPPKFPSRKDRHRLDNMSNDEFLDMLDTFVKRNKRRDDE
ncbi:efflux RND transporter permease subunit [Alteribacter keqinensis]|uniref:Efflux RND transporter permease subunit n=1 Tax=Alteribacter keqinensis TaxID=2483800 RepID=A0A3M7TWY5_9BACI|nr:efflux RND transporter permease subunit [Alteribacter keqinensis]RNA70140.1 efflux RND transporter permease subunit [Alteribacter keqinensis]